MKKREGFENWLTQKFGNSNGTKSSYLKAMDLLSRQLNKNLYEEFDENALKTLYQELKLNQRDKTSIFFAPDAPSYGANGFYSAAIKNYLVFLNE